MKGILKSEGIAEQPTRTFGLKWDETLKNLAYLDKEIHDAIVKRKDGQITRNDKNVTPKPLIKLEYLEGSFHKSTTSFWGEELVAGLFPSKKTISSRHLNINGTRDQSGAAEQEIKMEDIVASNILDFTKPLEENEPPKHQNEGILEKPKTTPSNKPKTPQYIKILLKETDVIDLYESPSVTVPKESNIADTVIKSNENYAYLTEGEGQQRRTATAEAQTGGVLYKTRSVNTGRIRKIDAGSFVSNYDMYDTYAELEMHVKQISLDENPSEKFELITYSKEGVGDLDQKLSENENFHISSMVLERILAGNIYQEKQKRFRNMYEPDPLDVDIKYLYRLETMWTYKMVETMNKAVVSASWCHCNGDLLAIAYGIYSYKNTSERRNGFVCIWSIKNPVNPERRYKYSIPVTAIQFSKRNPQLLAVGLYDGSIEILDIVEESGQPVARSERLTSFIVEPIWEIVWLAVTGSQGQEEILAACQDGRIMKYSLTSSHHLKGYQQLFLNHAEGHIEGLSIVHPEKDYIKANRHPQVLCLTVHPSMPSIYLVGTDEGCLYTCSTNHPHQHISILQAHRGSIYSIEYSPWSPRIFLTCGSDWHLRIWVDGIFEPILELFSDIGTIQCAQWSPVHSTIIVSCMKYSVCIWDLRRKNMKPASTHTFGAGTLPLTIVKFSKCGRSLIVGDEEGKTYVCALEDMPFSPHFQYRELESALCRGLKGRTELLKQLKGLGSLRC